MKARELSRFASLSPSVPALLDEAHRRFADDLLASNPALLVAINPENDAAAVALLAATPNLQVLQAPDTFRVTANLEDLRSIIFESYRTAIRTGWDKEQVTCLDLAGDYEIKRVEGEIIFRTACCDYVTKNG